MTDALIDKAREIAKASPNAFYTDTLHALIARLEAAERVCWLVEVDFTAPSLDALAPDHGDREYEALAAWRAIVDLDDALAALADKLK